MKAHAARRFDPTGVDDAKGSFFGDPGEGQINGERSEAVLTGAAGENLAVSKGKAKMPNFTSKSGSRVVYE